MESRNWSAKEFNLLLKSVFSFVNKFPQKNEIEKFCYVKNILKQNGYERSEEEIKRKYMDCMREELKKRKQERLQKLEGDKKLQKNKMGVLATRNPHKEHVPDESLPRNDETQLKDKVPLNTESPPISQNGELPPSSYQSPNNSNMDTEDSIDTERNVAEPMDTERLEQDYSNQPQVNIPVQVKRKRKRKTLKMNAGCKNYNMKFLKMEKEVITTRKAVMKILHIVKDSSSAINR